MFTRTPTFICSAVLRVQYGLFFIIFSFHSQIFIKFGFKFQVNTVRKRFEIFAE